MVHTDMAMALLIERRSLCPLCIMVGWDLGSTILPEGRKGASDASRALSLDHHLVHSALFEALVFQGHGPATYLGSGSVTCAGLR